MNITPEQRQQWREDAEREQEAAACTYGDCDPLGGVDARILALLDALDAAESEALREVGRKIADLRKRNPINGDGSNYTLGLLLASLQSDSADEGNRERMAERDAADNAMYERLDRENRKRADRIGGDA